MRNPTYTLVLCSSISLALALVAVAPKGAFAADCFDDLRIGLFTERHYGELDRPWRDRTNDPKIDSLAKTALRSLRADVSLVKAEALDSALAQARGNNLPVLAYLDVEAKSDALERQALVNIKTSLRLQVLNSGDGAVLGESTDFDEVKGLDIEQALPELVEVSSLSIMAEEAGRKACKNGLGAEAVVAEQSPSQGSGGGQDTIKANTKTVSDIQYVLIDLGFDVGEADGLMGERTRLAIENAQRDLREPPNGKPSTGLLEKLRTRLKGMVFEAQTLLADLGRFEGQPTGVLDPTTELAIEGFELERRLPADGKPDPDVLTMLRAEQKG